MVFTFAARQSLLVSCSVPKPFVAMFFIASFLAYIKSHKFTTNNSQLREVHTQWLWLVFCFLLCTASMLCKEQGITVLGVCAVYEVMVLLSHVKNQTNFAAISMVCTL